MKKLTDRVAVITGAGGGIGRATAVLLAQRGCRLAIADINDVGLAETARLVRELGRPVTTHKVDVSNKERMQEFATEVVDAHGAVHILINNAGVAVVADFKDHSLEDFEWLMGINFWGVVYGCKFFLPHLSLAEEGHIVNISSLFGLVGVPQQTSYCASKFAVRGFSEALRVELAASKVGVTSVHPGGIATNIVADARLAGSAEDPKTHAAMVKSFKKMMPPAEAAESIVHGITRNKGRVLITRESYVGDLAKRLMPALSTDLMAWGYERFRAKKLAR
jgi:NAD(P)-dependent dehydrogenase (short-subunit alcohol dehydrogenase family)